MTHWNVHIHAFGDKDMLQEAVASVPDGIPIHVFDGRYMTFPGGYDTTPQIAEFCKAHPDCIYYEPPEAMLPFGDPNTPGEWRSAVAEKAQWAFKHLPESEWTLKMDTDERIASIDEAAFDDFKPSGKFAPVIDLQGDERGRCHIARVWQPQYWTPWIDDCVLPRDLMPRDACLERLHTAWFDYETLRFSDRYETDAIVIRNVGMDRPTDYLERRWMHLKNIGREDRAAQLEAHINNEHTT